MSLDSPLSLVMLVEGGGEIDYWKTQGRPEKANLVFFHVINQNVESIGYKKKNELGFFEKVQHFFGLGKFSTAAINRIANEILVEKTNMTKVSEENKKLVGSALDYVLENATVKKFVRKIFPTAFSEIGNLEKLLSSLQPSPPTAPESLVGRVTIGEVKKKEPTTGVEIPSQGVTKPEGRGIENPACLCYCNSTIKAIWSSPALRASIWKDEKNETALVLEAFSRVQKELGKDKPALAPDDIELIAKHCPDLKFTLTHEPPTLDKVIKRKQQVSEEKERTISRRQVRESLLKVLEELDRPGKEPLTYGKEPLKSLREGLIGLFPHLIHDGVQQDQSDLFEPFLEAILPPGKRTPIVYHTEKERPTLNHDSGEKNVERLKQQVYIPVLDSKETPPQSHSIFIHHPPTDEPAQKVQNIFSSEVKENVEVSAFIDQEKNKWLTEDQKKLLRSAADAQGRLSPVQVKQTLTFAALPPSVDAEPPPFFPLYIARFADRTRKNKIKITAPFNLEVSVAGKEKPARYQLRGIVMHSSSSTSLQGGHYHNYFPLPDSPKDENGWPKKWVEHSDSQMFGPYIWDKISQDVSENATLYLYDRIG